MEPLREKRHIDVIRKVLALQNLRDAAWFTLGIDSDLGIGDLLHLMVDDVCDTPTKWRERLHITEQKTGKTKAFPLSASAKRALAAYLATRPEARVADPLFPSRKQARSGLATVGAAFANSASCPMRVRRRCMASPGRKTTSLGGE